MFFKDYINQIRQLFKQNREQGQQPGYAPFAAYEAIRRHALTNLKKDLTVFLNLFLMIRGDH